MHKLVLRIFYKSFLFADLISTTCGQKEEDDWSGWHFYISGVLTGVTGVAGMLGNMLSVVILLHR